MTSFHTFLSKLLHAVSEYYGESYKVEINKIQKNNGIVYHGLTIMDTDSNISPTIYMEKLYQEYAEGEPLFAVMEKVIRIYENNRIKGNVNIQFFLDFAQVRERIVYKLVNYERNSELLSDVPHIPFLDMAVVCYCSIIHDTLGSINILIRKQMCRMWGIEETDLFVLAKKNTPRILKARIRNMEQVVTERAEDAWCETGESYMYVLTNSRGLFGAACLLYPEVLREFSEKIGESLYILPSSVHEVILVPDKPEFVKTEFEQIVQEINRTHVEPEEVLSDHVYYYDREGEAMRML